MNKPQTDFWSRRKARVAEEAAAPVEAQMPEAEPMSDADILAALDLPDPDTIALGDDIKGFMDKAVPAHLRRRALRTLWRTNPVLANLDGLVDYADDYTDAATVKTDMQTAYQVGKGMLAHVQEMARQAEALTAAGPEEITEEEALPVTEVETPEIPDHAERAVAVAEQSPAPRARMRISYGADTQSEAPV
ncbi:DUF3306 domain-containing protein [Loktanella agnita]|uniref:DUF3306 domain-containing protein n=1 Tax=Loktanella agnita TaxID=287097 RepID=UPI003986E45C